MALASLSLAMAGSDRAQGMTLRAAGGLLAPGCEENEGRGPDGARQDLASLWEPPPPAAAGEKRPERGATPPLYQHSTRRLFLPTL